MPLVGYKNCPGISRRATPKNPGHEAVLGNRKQFLRNFHDPESKFWEGKNRHERNPPSPSGNCSARKVSREGQVYDESRLRFREHCLLRPLYEVEDLIFSCVSGHRGSRSYRFGKREQMKRTMILKLVSKYDFPTKGIVFLVVVKRKVVIGIYYRILIGILEMYIFVNRNK